MYDNDYLEAMLLGKVNELDNFLSEIILRKWNLLLFLYLPVLVRDEESSSPRRACQTGRRRGRSYIYQPLCVSGECKYVARIQSYYKYLKSVTNVDHNRHRAGKYNNKLKKFIRTLVLLAC